MKNVKGKMKKRKKIKLINKLKRKSYGKEKGEETVGIWVV